MKLTIMISYHRHEVFLLYELTCYKVCLLYEFTFFIMLHIKRNIGYMETRCVR